MSFLGHISVCETHGIRRFLYPVSLEIPASLLHPAHGPGLIMADDRPIPLQVTPSATNPGLYCRLDFAVSLSPLEKLELKLLTGGEAPSPARNFTPEAEGLGQVDRRGTRPDPDDPLQIEEKKRFRSTQRRFSVEFDRCGTLHEVVYDSVPHLRAPAAFNLNGRSAALEGASAFAAGFPLSARVTAVGQYPDGCGALTHLETTAYKSWVTLTHLLSRTQPEDELVFNLPMAVSSSVVTCDFGVGGAIYGSLQPETCPDMVWNSEFLRSGGVRWSITSSGRADYLGETKTAEEYLRQQWFHQVDGRKALAVAITQIPRCCREMKVTLRANGDVAVAFRIGEAAEVPAAFGLCCHFLNNIPAIAAATNPQSILLPPVVSKDF
ncbi:MAG TPA: hypothetical protein HPP81_02190 [Deltaproteobacteria bacterium]|jgi:hypothetical protein|nr:hypothetical protein [Deltaproteobacteria bacterium]